MRDDILAAIAWCRHFKIPASKSIVVEEANFFHPIEDAPYPFLPIADVYLKRIEFDKKDPKGPEQLALKIMLTSVYGKTAERKFRGIDPKTGAPMIPPHTSPWYASAITAHTRRELMTAALRAPECILSFATDAVISAVPLALPRLKSEADIKAGKEDKLLGDWCWQKIPAAIFIQSGMVLILDEDGKVVEAKTRGLPLKDISRAQQFADDVLQEWARPYDPKNPRFVEVKIKAFMPITSAIVSPTRYDNLKCMWGEITKKVLIDDAGGKRNIDPTYMDLLAQYAVPTTPVINPSPDTPSTILFPEWVENELREENRQNAACAQFTRMEDDAIDDAIEYYLKKSASDDDLDDVLDQWRL